MTRKPLDHPLSHALLILLLGILAYANSLGGPMVFDDLESIVDNQTIRNLGNFLPGGAGYEFHLRRWVAYFTFALNYRLGGLAVSGYHLVNLAVHLATALLVYALARLTFRTPNLAGSRLAPHSGMVALLAALFFVAHPVQTQAVVYLVQRITSLATCFYLLALVLYVRGRLEQERAKAVASLNPRVVKSSTTQQLNNSTTQRPSLALPCFIGATLATLLAMFTKEIAFTLPLAAGLFEISFFRGTWRPRLLALLPLLLTLPIIPVLVVIGGELSATGTLLETRLDIPRWHYLLTQFPVIVTYLRLLLLPIGQNVDYDYPVYTTFFTPPVFLSFLFLLALFLLALYLSGFRLKAFHQPPAPELRLIAFGLLWFFLTLAVDSSLIPLPDVIFEHRLYLPSVGLAMALAVGIVLAAQLTTPLYGGRLPLLAAAVAIIALSAATWQRNQVWQSEIRLWQDVTRKSPGKARPWYNLGTHLTDSGQPAEALPPLLRAVTLDPQYAEAWHNLGRAYLLSNRVNEALPPLRAAVRLNPEMDNAAVNLAASLIRTDQPGEAVPLLERVCQRLPEWADARYNLGLAYVGVGNLNAARRELTQLGRLSPPHARALAKLIDQAARASQPQ